MSVTLKQVREKLEGYVDTASVKNGVFTVRREFFYTHGATEQNLVKRILAAFPAASILDSGEIWKPFRGGGTTAQNSHWWVKFSVSAS